MITFEVAQQYEHKGEWKKAIEEWKRLKPLIRSELKDYVQNQIDTIESIISAVNTGNKYRKMLEPATKLYEQNLLTDKEYHDIIRTVYNKIYKA